MSGAFYVGAVGLTTQQRALDAIANNVANINTTGFKRSEVRFADVVASGPDAALVPADLQSAAPTLAGVALDLQFMLNDQGELQKTGAAMDIAIEGGGFIELMGADGRTLLWRGGRLRIGEDGLLGGAGGLALKAGITVPDDATAMTIDPDGTVRVQGADGTDPVEIGQIPLVRVADPAGVERLDEAPPGEDGAGRLVQGSVERSNVQLSRAVELAPDFHLARFQLGFFELTSAEPARAMATWEPLGVLPEDHYLAHFVAGLTHLIHDRFPETIRALEAGSPRIPRTRRSTATWR